MIGTPELRHVDEEILQGLLAVAVNDAASDEVMPPVAGPPGWTPARQDAFRAWHWARRPGLAGPLRESTFAIVVDGHIVGSARLACRDSQEVLETGMWLARSARGRGIGTAALQALLNEAARGNVRLLVAETTATNLGAIAALRRNDARLTTDPHNGHVHAQLPLNQAQPPPPASPNP
ncbi:GNAT family N-acetyltransferase [Streptomyces sp. NPDC005283]|uniref:GNAT family N-acetyltransferase n=1 Tax=Streptomyces sp. NPDC005283 TaxID=3156871 RepID=UPI0034512B37